MPSLTAKTKSACSVVASPILPRWRTSWASNCRPRKVSSLFLRTFPWSVWPHQWRRAGLPGGCIGFGEEGGEFEVDQAKASVGLAVGDVAPIGVVVANAVFEQLVEELLG